MATNDSSEQWTSLIRFEDEHGSVHFGQPIDSQMAEAAIWEGKSIFDLKRTQSVKKVTKLLAPYEPDTILCIGLNYQDHAREAKVGQYKIRIMKIPFLMNTQFPIPTYPIVFHKSKNALTSATASIPIPSFCKAMDYENELCVVLGRTTKNVPASEVISGGYIFAYTVGNDLSARDWQKREVSGGQFCYAKSFDAFLPLGPALVRPSALGMDPADLRIVTRVNGEVCQDSSTNNMIFDVPQLVEFLSRGTTLESGTLIMTGTPNGVAAFRKNPPEFLKINDVVECEIEGLGCLKNTLVAAAE